MTLFAPIFHRWYLMRLKHDLEHRLRVRKLAREARSQASQQGHSNHLKRLGEQTRKQFEGVGG